MPSNPERTAASETVADFAFEVRFGLVLYGGVSLAIYMNGVTTELYEMVCATPRTGVSCRRTTGTREIYRRLAWLAANPALRDEYANRLHRRARGELRPGEDAWNDELCEKFQPARLVVDVISGTSAGGINGIF
ncbi:MAG TPA: hypothetical protein VIG66_06905, partial [Noviherbaspirillum sp.]